MALDVLIFGTLVLSPGDLSAWKRVIVDPARYRAIARVFPRGLDVEPTTAGALLKRFPSMSGYDLFRIERDDGIYRVQGQFAERPFRNYARQLAAFFMSAADVGVHGDVYFLGHGVREGYALQLSGGRPTLATLGDEEIERRSRIPILDAISAHFRVAPPSNPPPAIPVPPSPISSRPLLEFPRGIQPPGADGSDGLLLDADALESDPTLGVSDRKTSHR